MCLEIETKFRLQDCLALERQLPAECQTVKPWHFESNTVYDRGGELFAKDMLLRLRVTGSGSGTLTLKIPAPGHDSTTVKARHETECRTCNPVELDSILRILGYQRRLHYEKFRAVFRLEDTELFLDILPFGHFLEIEGSASAICSAAQRLGLNPDQGIASSYHALHHEWRKANTLPPDDNFTFTPEDKLRHMTLLGCAAVLS